MIKLKDITMNYGNDYILKNLSHVFKKGLVYGLIGKNGAGKTTLLKIIMRLVRENQGSVLIDGNFIDDVDFLKVPATFIGDHPIFYSDLTVREHLLLMCNSQKIKKKDAVSRINLLLDELRLTKYENNFPHTLSKGTLQRLNIALGFIRNERIILMDEPFNALDPVQVSSVEKLILKSKEKGKTLLISSHDIDSLGVTCDIYLILRNGQLLEYKPDELTKESISQIIGDSYGD